MQIRIIQIITLALVLAFAPPALAAKSDGDEKAVFKAAYKAYQEAVEAKDAHAAMTAAGEALEMGKSVFPDDSPSLAALYVNYGMALVDAGTGNTGGHARKAEDAIAPLRKGIKRYEKLYGKKDGRLIDPLWSLADAHSKTLKPKKAVPVMGRTLRLVRKVHGEDSFAFAEVSLAMGEMHYKVGQRQAISHFQTAYDIYQQKYGKPAYKTGIAAFWLGRASQTQGRRDKAEIYYLDALDIFEKSTSPGHDLQVAAHTYLIELLEERGKSEEATMHCQAISRIRPLVGVAGHKPLFKRAPIYPQSARRGGRSGYVVVEFTVTALGTVADAIVVESDGGKDFEPAALKAASGFRYAPAVIDGELVETTNVRNLITFTIVQ